MKTFFRLSILIIAFWTFDPAVAAERCGATERWAVKLGTDPDASNVERDNIRDTTVVELNELPQLHDNIPAKDNTTRLEEERVVYRVSGRLVLFKNEDDDDYHLVITDDSLKFTPGGPGTKGKETGTSFIAEIPDPKCYAGKKGSFQDKSAFEEQLRDSRIKFERRFPAGEGADTDLGGIPVTIVGVAFYDRQHNQTGRAKNGIELHPILDIEFNDGERFEAGNLQAMVRASATPLFREGGTWSTNKAALRERSGVEEEEDDDEPNANSIQIGGNGRPQTDSIWQTARVNKAPGATLHFVLRIKTDDKSVSPSSDTLLVQARTASGKLLKTLARFSNADARRRPRPVSLDIGKFRGRTIRFQFTSRENSTKATRFAIGNIHISYR
jgi:hypothetical protein